MNIRQVTLSFELKNKAWLLMVFMVDDRERANCEIHVNDQAQCMPIMMDWIRSAILPKDAKML